VIQAAHHLLTVMTLFGQETPDPTSFVTSLGAFAAAAGALILWQRDTAKQRDRLLELEEQRGPLLNEMKNVMQANTQTLNAVAEALRVSAQTLTKVPSDVELIRWRDTMTRLENIATDEYPQRRRGG
jgi:hypothetical protein